MSNRSRYSYRGHVDYINTIAWSPDGRWLASAGGDSTVQIWEAATGSTKMICMGHELPVHVLAWSPDGKRLASAGEDYLVYVWNAQDGTHQLTYRGHTDTIDSLAWSPDGKQLASGSYDRTVQIWDAVSGALHLTYYGHKEVDADTLPIAALAWSPSGFYLASGGDDPTYQVWDAATGKQLQVFQEQQGDVVHLAWHRNGSTLFAACHRKMIIRDARTGTVALTALPPKEGIIFAAALSPTNCATRLKRGEEANERWRKDSC